MSKRFIVAIDNATHPQRELRRERFIGYAKGRGLLWWNRIPSFWLLVDESGQLTASKLDDDVRDIFGAPCVIIELRSDNDTWAGHGPKGMFEWLKSEWKEGAKSPFSHFLEAASREGQPSEERAPLTPLGHPPGNGRRR